MEDGIMRIWSIHPKYLDRLGLGGAWKEAHQAQAILRRGIIEGQPFEKVPYGMHSQLIRFKAQPDPLGALGLAMTLIRDEGLRRGYNYKARILRVDESARLWVSEAQLAYERLHMVRKLRERDTDRADALPEIPDVMPMVDFIGGGVASWERNVDPADEMFAIEQAMSWGMAAA